VAGCHRACRSHKAPCLPMAGRTRLMAPVARRARLMAPVPRPPRIPTRPELPPSVYRQLLPSGKPKPHRARAQRPQRERDQGPLDLHHHWGAEPSDWWGGAAGAGDPATKGADRTIDGLAAHVRGTGLTRVDEVLAALPEDIQSQLILMGNSESQHRSERSLTTPVLTPGRGPRPNSPSSARLCGGERSPAGSNSSDLATATPRLTPEPSFSSVHPGKLPGMSPVETRAPENADLNVLEAMEAADPGARAEYINGAFTLNRPTPRHQSTVLELAVALRSLVPQGYRVLTEVRVRSESTWLTPDLIVVPEAVALGETSPLSPDDLILICEVLSPSTETKDRTHKRAFAEQHHIDYWLVGAGDPWGTIETMPYGGGIVPTPESN